MSGEAATPDLRPTDDTAVHLIVRPGCDVKMSVGSLARGELVPGYRLVQVGGSGETWGERISRSDEDSHMVLHGSGPVDLYPLVRACGESMTEAHATDVHDWGLRSHRVWLTGHARVNVDFSPLGCHIDEHLGQYGGSAIVQLADEILGTGFTERWPRTEDGELLGTYRRSGSPWSGLNLDDDLELMVDLMDAAEAALNGATDPGWSWGWHSGEFFLMDQDWWEGPDGLLHR